MSTVKSPEAPSNKPAEIEQNTTAARRQSNSVLQAEDTGEKASTLLLRFSVDSTREIDRLIDSLKNLREKLKSDGARLQRDIVEYASLGQSAVQLTKIVTDSMNNTKGMSEAASADTRVHEPIVPKLKDER
jgi:hypothetical protein